MSRNAVITHPFIRIGRKDGRLSAGLAFDDGSTVTQIFGCNDIYVSGKETSLLGRFISRVLETVDADDWNELVGKAVRIVESYGRVTAVGHIIKDQWFELLKEFEDIGKNSTADAEKISDGATVKE